MQNTEYWKQKQMDRTVRARSAIHAGRFLVTRIEPQKWTVQNGETTPYVVTFTSANENPNQREWFCTCKDFQEFGPELLCKHIEAVRILEEEQTCKIPRPNKEDHMSDREISTDEEPGGIETVFPKENIFNELSHPLDISKVKHYQISNSGVVPFLDGCEVIDQANRLFGFAWSFELLGEPVFKSWQKKVLVWNQQENRKVPTLDANGNFQTEDVGLAYVTGSITVDLNGKSYSHADLGSCIFSGDSPAALDVALSGAVSNCIKRCFRQLGNQFGNQFYDREISTKPRGSQKSSTQTGTTQSGKASLPTTALDSEKLNVIREYGDGLKVNGNLSEREAFDRYLQKTGKAPFSKEKLRTWLSDQQNTIKSQAIIK